MENFHHSGVIKQDVGNRDEVEGIGRAPVTGTKQMIKEMEREMEEYVRMWHSRLIKVVNDLNMIQEEDIYNVYLDIMYGDLQKIDTRPR